MISEINRTAALKHLYQAIKDLEQENEAYDTSAISEINSAALALE